MKDLAYWPSKEPLPREKTFLKKRNFLEKIEHVDQIWDHLKKVCGNQIAASDLRGHNHEEFSYSGRHILDGSEHV